MIQNKYAGYLLGVNPNYTRKVLQDDDPRYFSMDNGYFVNNKGEEVKTLAEAVEINDKIDKEYKEAFPPQRAIGSKPVRQSKPVNKVVKKQQKETLFQDIFDKNGLRSKPKIESDASVNRRIWKKVEDNRAKGRADYQDFQDHEMIVANSYADTKKLQKEITDNLNEYIKNKIPEMVQTQSYSTPTPSFIESPKPKSLGIADPELLRERVMIGKVLNDE